jgi:hypothetical protein
MREKLHFLLAEGNKSARPSVSTNEMGGRTDMKTSLVLVSSLVLLLANCWAADSDAAGTAIPVVLSHGIDANRAKAGDSIEAKTTQAVHLDAVEVPKNAKITGRIVSVRSVSETKLPALSLAFDRLALPNGKQVPVTVSLLAAASPLEALDAQIPATGPDEGTSEWAWSTKLIGGGERYGFGGRALDARGNEDRNAVGIFSSDACGLYGMDGLAIQTTDDPGIIGLTSSSYRLRVPKGTVLLLQLTGLSALQSELLSSTKK